MDVASAMEVRSCFNWWSFQEEEKFSVNDFAASPCWMSWPDAAQFHFVLPLGDMFMPGLGAAEWSIMQRSTTGMPPSTGGPRCCHARHVRTPGDYVVSVRLWDGSAHSSHSNHGERQRNMIISWLALRNSNRRLPAVPSTYGRRYVISFSMARCNLAS